MKVCLRRGTLSRQFFFLFSLISRLPYRTTSDLDAWLGIGSKATSLVEERMGYLKYSSWRRNKVHVTQNLIFILSVIEGLRID